MKARGYPVALEARALDLESLALTSMTRYSSESGDSANWTLHSPIIPTCLIIFIESSLSLWYSLLVSVCEGATTMLSPVWMPRGSKFSILHTVMQLSYLSLTTSYSTSFQPLRLSSTSIWFVYENARAARVFNSRASEANPLPWPPRV